MNVEAVLHPMVYGLAVALVLTVAAYVLIKVFVCIARPIADRWLGRTSYDSEDGRDDDN